MSVPLEQMLEELRKAEQARDLMSEVDRRLSAGNTDLENLLRQLEQLGQSLPESDPIRLLIEDAVGAARTRDSIKAGSDVSRSRSAIEGEISSLRGAIQSVQVRPLRKGPRARKAVPTAEQLQASQKSFQNFSKILSYLPGGTT
jgi:hypothetical protein